jgi:hypothetical protein
VPEPDDSLDAMDHHYDRREALTAIVITTVALAVMLVTSLLVVLSSMSG